MRSLFQRNVYKNRAVSRSVPSVATTTKRLSGRTWYCSDCGVGAGGTLCSDWPKNQVVLRSFVRRVSRTLRMVLPLNIWLPNMATASCSANSFTFSMKVLMAFSLRFNLIYIMRAGVRKVKYLGHASVIHSRSACVWGKVAYNWPVVGDSGFSRNRDKHRDMFCYDATSTHANHSACLSANIFIR